MAIGKNVWIGVSVTVAAGVVVSKAVPVNVIAGGVSAKSIRHISSQKSQIKNTV